MVKCYQDRYGIVKKRGILYPESQKWINPDLQYSSRFFPFLQDFNGNI